ncbi:Ankyrin repeat protein 1 [Giardia muris]|uniref:Ankyrin repeat protein 1 n=1 Tax=Giardia muris TaxID=5742 RepID=A0A4Z1SUG8_GIAMU|nr:Ankyrin repeat protein 1 [Giardia muris]|eukprot:TNJ28615.1 Ankyrin repeat protein 1 [Giardia muris]
MDWFAALLARNHARLREGLPIHKRSRDVDGLTALHLAASYGDIDAVEILAPEESTLLDAAGETALIRAIRSSHIRVVHMLASLEAKVPTRDGKTALQITLELRSLEYMQAVVPFSDNEYLPAIDRPSSALHHAVLLNLPYAIPIFAMHFSLSLDEFNFCLGAAKSAPDCLTLLNIHRADLLQEKCARCGKQAASVAELELKLESRDERYISLQNEITQLKQAILRKHCSIGTCVECRATIVRSAVTRDQNTCTLCKPMMSIEAACSAHLPSYDALRNALDKTLGAYLALKAQASDIEASDALAALKALSLQLTTESLSELDKEAFLSAIRGLVQMTAERTSLGLSGSITAPDPTNVDRLTEVEYKYTVLQHALEELRTGWPTTLMKVAAEGSDEGVKKHLFLAGLQDNEGKTALMFAAEAGHLECVRQLIEKEGRMRDNQGRTALMYATAHNRIECCHTLLKVEGRFSTNSQHRYKGTTALMVAARNNFTDLVKLLVVEEGAITRDDGVTALMQAAQANAVDSIKLLLTKEARRSTNDEFIHGPGYTALMFAVSNGNYEVARILAKHEGTMQLPNGNYASTLTNDPQLRLELLRYEGHTD